MAIEVLNRHEKKYLIDFDTYEKLRLRSYDTPDSNSKVNLEIKKKVSGFVNQRRSTMHLHEGYDFLKTDELPDIQPERILIKGRNK